VASWFETREDALLATRDQIRKVLDLILRSIAKRCVSKDESIDVKIALLASLVGQNPAAPKYALLFAWLHAPGHPPADLGNQRR
jgi:hypothetical protein